MKSNQGKRVLVAMSGGVDSSAAALLLRQQGYQCDGAMLKLIPSDDSRCCSADDAEDARAVAYRLGMKFYVFNEVAAFRRDVYQCTADELCALLQKSNLPLYGTALRNDTVSLRDAELSRAAVAIGSEGRGLSAEILSKCEKTIKIPMSPRCESLNAAVAAAIVMWNMKY